MRKFGFCVIAYLFFQGGLFAQNSAAQSVYAELYGAGLAYSVNYEFRFDKNDINSWGMRVGAGGYATGNSNNFERLLTVPVQFNKLFGKSRHLFELGGGGTLIYFRDRNSSGGIDYVNKNFDFFLESSDTPALMGTLNFGYRRIPEDGGFLFRANISPFFNHNGFWLLFGGVSLGYAF
ncbi:MAG TPA: hypothetical protein VK957_18665 [Lunatimonas sp.]|nr:hypothetical protein [Lunatimonas sp.]